jgi:hypothetical protein
LNYNPIIIDTISSGNKNETNDVIPVTEGNKNETNDVIPVTEEKKMKLTMLSR